MPKSKVRKKNDFTINPVSRTPVKVKAGPSSIWFVVLFVGLMLIGLVWLLVFQLAASNPVDTPSFLQWMSELGPPWNYAIAFAFMITGLLLTMRWR
jgi:Cell division protein CrgA